MNYQTIQRRSAAELVMKEILESVRTGELKPGDKLPPEKELTKMFGVGRSTLREAISALVLVECLEVRQGRGTFLRQDFELHAPYDLAVSDIQAAANIYDLLETREILECSAVQLAAERANKAKIRVMKKALAGMQQAAGDVQAFVSQDFDFHISIARSTGNEMIPQVMHWILKRVYKEYQEFSPKALFEFERAILTAEQILSCVVKREGEKAAYLMRDHLNLVVTELKRVVPDVKGPRAADNEVSLKAIKRTAR